MVSGYVRRQVARSNRNLLIVNVLVVACGVAVVVYFREWLATAFRGPQRATPEQIGAYRSADEVKDWYVTVSFDRSRFSDSYHEVRGSSRSKRHYHYYRLPQGALVVGSGEAVDPPTELTGVVERPGNTPAWKEVLRARDDVRHVLSSVIVEKHWPLTWVWAVGVPVGVVMLVAGWNLVKVARRAASPARHPSVRALSAVGDAAAVGAALDCEVGSARRVGRRVRVTRSFVCRERRFGFDVVPLADVAWAYRRETANKPGPIATYTEYATVICDRRGGAVEFPMTAAQTDELLAAVRAAAPRAVIGFDAELDRLWKGGLSGFLGAVDARWSGAPAAGAPA